MSTIAEEILKRVRERALDAEDKSSPVAILWTDPTRSFEGLVRVARALAPELLTLGTYHAEDRTGPVIWLRCVVDKALAGVVPAGRVPIVYLPGVARQELRAGEQGRPELQPLVELLYRGAAWLHDNGGDWTLSAFLTSPKGLGLRIDGSRATQDALARALGEVALTPLASLKDRPLAVADFDALLDPDPPRTLLQFLVDPAAVKALGTERYATFKSQARQQFGLDVDREGPLSVAERLCRGGGAWDRAWERFEQAPSAYRGALKTLLRVVPPADLFSDRRRYLKANADAEELLEKSLREAAALPQLQACTRVLDLESEHRGRRESVWAKLERAPLAVLLEPLARLADAARAPIGGLTPDEAGREYAEHGWKADVAAWEALAAAAGQSDAAYEPLVSRLVRTLLGEWLDLSARAFQHLLAAHPLPTASKCEPVESLQGGCLLFADGLRYDVACRLAEDLEGRGFRVTRRTRWAALPTVTATAKNAVTPLTREIEGATLPADFAPRLVGADRTLNAQGLRAALKAHDVQVLSPEDLGFPEGREPRGWIELGQIDAKGHQLGRDLAQSLRGEIDRLAQAIRRLLEAGWSSVRVVTDHGWLLLPEGLPRVDLPKHLTACRWSRVAVVHGGMPPGVVAVPWHWNPIHSVATPPGAACFNVGEAYAHGGVSLQECLLPDFIIERGGEAPAVATLHRVAWRKMRVTAECRGSLVGVRADLRLGGAQGPSVVRAPKDVEADGQVSFVVSDEHENAPLVLVLLAKDKDEVLAQVATRVGLNTDPA